MFTKWVYFYRCRYTLELFDLIIFIVRDKQLQRRSMKKQLTRTSFFLFGILWLTLSACTQESRSLDLPEADLASAALIPLPGSLEATGGSFPLDRYTAITTSDDEGFVAVGTYLANAIQDQIGLDLSRTSGPQSVIHIEKSNASDEIHSEGYSLVITTDSIVLRAFTAAGAFRGIQTIRQLIPVMYNDSLADYPIWIIPSGRIMDAPQYGYRASMLDVSRHFFSVTDVKKYLDLLAYYKFNVLHLHLSDDQGWRIEIKSWPKLTEIGGSTEVGGGPGGFYTQEEFSDIVAYAAERHIMIVPEIDMPGHTNAASASYPILNGNGKTPELYTGRDVGFSTFDTRKDTVYAFIDDVVREISGLVPGPYFHVGGDESHVTQKPDYNYFMERVEDIVQKYGKRMIGWDEVATAPVDSSSIAQVWASQENGQQAMDKGMDIILSIAKKAYLDMKYDTLSEYGYTWAGLIPVDTGYMWSPESYFPEGNVIGIDAPLWSETISNIEELEYLAFPRVIGYGELAWTPEVKRDWADYKVRLAGQAPFLARMNVQYYRSPKIDWVKVENESED